MLLMVWFGTMMTYTVAIYREYRSFGIGFFDAYEALGEVLKTEPELHGEFMKSLLMQYGFTALGAVPTIMNIVKQRGVEHHASRMGEM